VGIYSGVSIHHTTDRIISTEHHTATATVTNVLVFGKRSSNIPATQISSKYWYSPSPHISSVHQWMELTVTTVRIIVEWWPSSWSWPQPLLVPYSVVENRLSLSSRLGSGFTQLRKMSSSLLSLRSCGCTYLWKKLKSSASTEGSTAVAVAVAVLESHSYSATTANMVLHYYWYYLYLYFHLSMEDGGCWWMSSSTVVHVGGGGGGTRSTLLVEITDEDRMGWLQGTYFPTLPTSFLSSTPTLAPSSRPHIQYGSQLLRCFSCGMNQIRVMGFSHSGGNSIVLGGHSIVLGASPPLVLLLLPWLESGTTLLLLQYCCCVAVHGRRCRCRCRCRRYVVKQEESWRQQSHPPCPPIDLSLVLLTLTLFSNVLLRHPILVQQLPPLFHELFFSKWDNTGMEGRVDIRLSLYVLLQWLPFSFLTQSISNRVVSFHSTNDTTLTLSLGQERVQSCGVFPPLSTVLDRSQKYCGWMDGWIDL